MGMWGCGHSVSRCFLDGRVHFMRIIEQYAYNLCTSISTYGLYLNENLESKSIAPHPPQS